MNRVDSVDLEAQLYDSINYRAKNDKKMKGFKNIALFGVDSRSGDLLDGDNRSDTIMIASINEKTGEIHLVSVYRDTVLAVGDEYYTKANTAYALGGPAQAIAMLNRNLDLNILDFVTVGFEGLAHTIDALGGIEIEIDEEEREYLNQYVHDMHIELGTDETPVEQSGLVTLTGIQATAYSRIRYTAGDDFRRAERQRTVLEKTLEKARGASPTTLIDVANNVVGDMATSLSSREIVSMILMAPKLNLADTGGIPQEDLRDFTTIEAGSAVMPVTLSDNSTWLHQFLFDDDVYKPSEEVELRSSWIMNNLPQGVYY
jgi:LCP family protein required for cell wall assembly